MFSSLEDIETPQNGKTHSNNSSAVADQLFEYVWPFYGVGAWRVKTLSLETICDYKHLSQYDTYSNFDTHYHHYN